MEAGKQLLENYWRIYFEPNDKSPDEETSFVIYVSSHSYAASAWRGERSTSGENAALMLTCPGLIH